MSEKHAKEEKGTLTRKRLSRTRSLVGPGARERCFSNKIATVLCDVLQPEPELPLKDLPVLPSDPNQKNLVPSLTRVLCLWKDKEDDEYHLTAIKEDKDDVFLDLHLSKLLTGEIQYDANRQWHEVAVSSSNSQPPRRLVFLLKSSSCDHAEVKEFNNKLEAVFKEILQTGASEESKAAVKPPGSQGNSANNKPTENKKTNVTPPGVKRNSANEDEVWIREGGSLTQPTAVVSPFVMADVSPSSGSEMASRQSINKPQATFPAKTLEQMALALAAAIQTGNVQTAKDLATMLAQAQTNVSISYDATAEEQKAREQEISVTVHVEDRESAGLTLNDIRVKPSDTILDLKRSFLGKYGFPSEVQKWIIGKRIPGDDETLSRCDITTSGHTLYLYVLNIRAVDPSHQVDRHLWQQRQAGAGNATGGTAPRPRQESDYETMNAPLAFAPATPPTSASASSTPGGGADTNTATQRVQGPPSTTGVGAMRQQSHLSTASSSTSLSATSFGLSDIRGNLDPGSGPNSGQRGSDGRSAEGVVSGMGQMTLTGGGGGMVEGHPLQGPPDDRLGQEEMVQGWQCPICTLINQPTRPGCEACGEPRPSNYQVPSDFIASDEERQRLEQERRMEAFLQQEELRERETNYQRLLQADSSDLVSNTEPFSCPICFDEIDMGQGIVLRECLHQFCRTCLTDTVRLTEEAELICPYQDDRYRCSALLQDREVRALVPDHVYEKYLRRSLDLAESQAANSYHCKTPDCRGWCIYEDMVNFFRCPVCRHENCLTCRAIHENQNCKQYQEDLRIRAANDKAAQQTQIMLQDMLDKGEAMHCPQCEVIVQKKDGCDWIRCSFCKTEICWVTKGRRWGPKGEGDNSGGCKCRVGGRRCHPKCNNCH